MQFKIDENLPIEIAEVLNKADTDFSDIRAYPPEEFSGIIVLRVKIQSKHHILKVFNSSIHLIGREPLMQHLWVVEEARVRIRGGYNE